MTDIKENLATADNLGLILRGEKTSDEILSKEKSPESAYEAEPSQSDVEEASELLAQPVVELPEPTPDTDEQDELPLAAAEEIEPPEIPQPASPAEVLQNAAQEINAARNELVNAYNSPEFAEMQKEDPGQAALVLQRMQSREAEIVQAENALMGAGQQQQQHQLQSYIKQEFDKVTTGPESTRIRNWDKPDVRAREHTAIFNHLKRSGYSEQEIMTLSAKDMKLVHSLMFRNSNPKPKKKKNFGKVTPKPIGAKPAARKPINTVEEIGNILNQTGAVRK